MTMSPESFPNSAPPKPPMNPNLIDLEPPNTFPSFEFHLQDPVDILPADQLFSNGKLMPLHAASSNSNLQPQNAPKLRRRNQDHVKDPCLFSPRAPKCSSRWKEMLGLKTLNQRQKESQKSVGLTAKNSIKGFLNRAKSSSVDSSLNLPLLRGFDTESESLSLSSSRLSLSSSSSSHENDEVATSTLPRISVSRNLMRKKVETKPVALDSPRMNSSGKIVFNTLERSSSTPSSNYGGSRYKNNKGIERCYSANVRITSVPVCSKSGVVFGFPLFSSSQQRKHCLKQKNGNSKKKVEKLTETSSYC